MGASRSATRQILRTVRRGRLWNALRAGVALAALIASCTSSSPGGSSKLRASGPPRVRVDVVARHAAELDEGELASRAAGSQQEEAAAAYVLGHLQQAGYGARLEGVPVANTVTSTDVLAVPAGGAPRVVVAVPYDTGVRTDPTGAAVGLFLELARALAVADPGHRVAFAALGAEATEVGGGHLGSARLVGVLEEEGEPTPTIMTLEWIELEGDATFGALGPEASSLTDVAERLGIPVAPPRPPDPAVGRELSERARLFAEAGFDHVGITGGAAEVGVVLLEYLAPRRRGAGGAPWA